MNKTSIKKILGEIPYAAEIYWGLIQRHKAWQSHFDLDLLESNLAKAVEETEPFYNAAKTRKSRKVRTKEDHLTGFNKSGTVIL